MEENPSQPAVSKSRSSKTMIIVVIVVILLLLGGAGYYLMGKNTTKQTSSTTTMAPKPSPTSASMFSSIQDALSKSLSLKCEFNDADTHVKTIAYIKGGAIRGDVTGKTVQENSSFIMKDKKMYFWNGKKGMMMAFDPADMMKQIPSISPATKGPDTSSQPNGTNMLSALEKFKESCKPSVVDEAMFVAPSDVTFQDLSKMMPSGAMMPKTSGAPAGMTQEQAQQIQKQMMEKYGTGTTSK